MKKSFCLLALIVIMLYAGAANAQGLLFDLVTNKVIDKYQNATCEQLWQERAEQQGKPKPEREQELIQILQGDPDLRAKFINKVAAPIANKMFQCGMIP